MVDHESKKARGVVPLDQKIEEVAGALKLTVAFKIELRESNAPAIDYVDAMIAELEERLTSLRLRRELEFDSKS